MDSNPRSPLLVANGGETRQRWWWWVIDPAEAKNQIIFSVPMVLTNLAYFLIPLISVMFAGHLGELELAGATLANSWSTVTGFAFLVGLSGSLETLCGQAFGAKAYRMLGLYIQASSIISLFTAILITIVWWFTDSILILLHQNPAIAIKAGLYMKCYIPGVFAYAAVQNILRFLQTQSVIYPLIFCSLIPLALHIGIAYIMVHLIGLGFKGAPLAASISFWVSLVLLVLYLKFSKKFVRTWTGFSNESFEHVLPSLKLALPSAAMVCLEYWVFELLVLLAGLMPDSEVSTSVIAILVNTEGIAFMIFYGLSAAASTRVSNELGAGHPDRGKHAMGVTLRLAVVLALLVLVLLGVGHDSWAHLFSDSTTIIAKFAALTPFLCVSIFFDGVQSMLSGVCRGGGWQNLAMLINLGAFYCVGMPVACVLAFKFKFYAKGLWIGLISGLAVQSTALLILTFFTKWSKVVAKNDSFEP